MKGHMKYRQMTLLLAIGLLLVGCSTMRQIADTGRKIADTIADNKDVVFDTIDGAIGVGETIKTNVTSVFKGSGTNTVAAAK
jgi:hypothetical protein